MFRLDRCSVEREKKEIIEDIKTATFMIDNLKKKVTT